MKAGFSKIEITPPLDRIESYGIGYWYQRAVRFTGVRDPLFVRTLSFGKQIVISVDSIFDSFGFIPDATARIARALGIDESSIFITCTHTHSSPLIDRNNTRRGIEYGAVVADRIVESALASDRNSVESTVSISSRQVTGVLYNRRPLLANGRIAELHTPLSEPVIDPGPINDTMSIVQFRREDGELLGGLCHFGIHGVVVQCSELISGDCMGRAIQAAEQALGNIVLLHLNGPCGDIDPALMGDDRSLDIMSTRLEERILEITNRPTCPVSVREPRSSSSGRFHAKRRETRPATLLKRKQQVPSEIVDLATRHHSGIGYESFLLAEEEAVSKLPQQFDIPYQILDWGNLRLVGIAGEIFTCFGLALQAARPDLLILSVGLTGGANGYLPAKQMYDQGGYEVACAQWCPIAPGETERLFAQIASELTAETAKTSREPNQP
jgi:neutral ceramidase